MDRFGRLNIAKRIYSYWAAVEKSRIGGAGVGEKEGNIWWPACSKLAPVPDACGRQRMVGAATCIHGKGDMPDPNSLARFKYDFRDLRS